ncbi:unnamed protein product [Rotaria socialis]|uniref:Uncharacterized protein n=1 Tax=Rotaria socialis TaxID=392032 RepID=A0A821M4Q3_9BILA|nr:unnamed protein product [Rotaria socialis]
MSRDSQRQEVTWKQTLPVVQLYYYRKSGSLRDGSQNENMNTVYRRRLMSTMAQRFSLWLAASFCTILLGGLVAAIAMMTFIKDSTTSTSTITTTTQTQGNITNTTVTSSKIYYCGGLSNFTRWNLYSSNGLYMNIDTTTCSFNSTPLYFTSMGGNDEQWFLAGYAAIYAATKVSFRIYMTSSNQSNNVLMLNSSYTNQWNVNWLDQTQANSNNTNVTTAEAYYCAGISSYTNWQLYSTSGITMNIDTSNCSFPSTPSYFVSISGTSSHWLLAGYTAIYFPTNISFTIYARPLIVWSNTYMLNNAQTCLWNINWFGISYST